MKEHTPGPWTADEMATEFTIYGGGLMVADVHKDVMELDDEMRANARLIAAAPDLLAACELMVASGIRGNATLNAAIAKARGGE